MRVCAREAENSSGFTSAPGDCTKILDGLNRVADMPPKLGERYRFADPFCVAEERRGDRIRAGVV